MSRRSETAGVNGLSVNTGLLRLSDAHRGTRRLTVILMPEFDYLRDAAGGGYHGALDDIASTCGNARIVESLVGRGRRIVSGCAERLGPEQIATLEQRLGPLEDRIKPARSANVGETVADRSVGG